MVNTLRCSCHITGDVGRRSRRTIHIEVMLVTGSDDHQVCHSRPLEGVGGRHQGDVPGGGQAALVREGQQEAVRVRAHQVDILDII